MPDPQRPTGTLNWPNAPTAWTYPLFAEENFLYKKLGVDLQKTGNKINFSDESPMLRLKLGTLPDEVKLHNLKQWFDYVEPIYRLSAEDFALSSAGMQPQRDREIVNFVYRDKDGTYRLYNPTEGKRLENLKGTAAASARPVAEMIPQVAAAGLTTGVPGGPVAQLAGRGLIAGGGAAVARAAFDKAAGIEDPRQPEEKRQELLGLGILSGLGEGIGGTGSLIGRGQTKRFLRGSPMMTRGEEEAFQAAGVRPNPQRIVKSRVDLFNRLVGRPPSLGTATGRGFLQTLEGLLSKYPWAKDIMERYSLDLIDSWGRRSEEILQDALPINLQDIPTGTRAGGIFRHGIAGEKPDSWISRLRDADAIRYGYLDAHVPETTPVESHNITEIKNLIKEWERDPKIDSIPGRKTALKNLQTLADNIVSPLNRLRTRSRQITLADLKEELDAYGPRIDLSQVTEISQSDRRAIYAVIKRAEDDVYFTADPSGKLLKLKKFADSEHAEGMRYWEHLLERVTGSKKPENIGDYRAMTGLENLAKNAADEYVTVMDNLSPMDRQAIRVAEVNRAARAGEGAPFDPWRLSSYAQKLPTESREAFAPAGSALDEWLRLQDRLIERITGVNVAQNPLFTEKMVTRPAMMVNEAAANREWGGIVQGLGTALATIKVPKGAAKLLTSKSFVQWVAEVTEASPKGGIERVVDQIITHPARMAVAIKGLNDYEGLIAFGQFLEGLFTFSQQDRTVSQSSVLNQANREQAAVDPSALTQWQGR